MIKSFKRRSNVFTEGEYPHNIYIIKYGMVKLWKLIPNSDHDFILYFAKNNDVLGLMDQINNGKSRTYSATVISNILVTDVIPFGEYASELFTTGDLNACVKELFFKMEFETWLKVTNYVDLDSRSRLIKFLIHLAKNLGELNENGEYEIWNISHQMLAEYMGTSRHTITSILNKLRKKQYVDYSRKHLIIKKKLIIVDNNYFKSKNIQYEKD